MFSFHTHTHANRRWCRISTNPQAHAPDILRVREAALSLGRRRLSVEHTLDNLLPDRDRWKGAGGVFGLQADWRRAIAAQDGRKELSLRGHACVTPKEQLGVRDILEKRESATVARKQVRSWASIISWLGSRVAKGFPVALGFDENRP